MGKKYAYLTLCCQDPLTKKMEYLIGQKKFMNELDGYIGTNPLQFVFPGGNVLKKESTFKGAVREFEEETGYKLENLKPINLNKIHQNKFADFYLAEISYDSKIMFKYSKEKVIAMGQYYEFDFFEWCDKEEIDKKLEYKPNTKLMIKHYLNYIQENKDIIPGWIISSDLNYCYDIYINAKNGLNINVFSKMVLNHIESRSINDWFIEFTKKFKN
jgi:hypothetical protein